MGGKEKNLNDELHIVKYKSNQSHQEVKRIQSGKKKFCALCIWAPMQELDECEKSDCTVHCLFTHCSVSSPTCVACVLLMCSNGAAGWSAPENRCGGKGGDMLHQQQIK